MNLAPIVLFVYNRPSHTRRTIKHLAKNLLALESDLYIYADGPKNAADKKVKRVRNIINKISGFKSVVIFEREENVGLASNVIDGITKVLAYHQKIIVMEDDLITSRHFLAFINGALEKYKDSAKVGMIHGHIYNIPELPENFFMYKAGCLGWGTWKHVWDDVEFDGKILLKKLQAEDLCSKFDINNSYPFTQMLRDQIVAKNNSWAIRLYASLLLNDKLSFYPGKSLVRHIGFDVGTHYNNQQATDMDGIIGKNRIELIEIPVVNSEDVIHKLNKFYLDFSCRRSKVRILTRIKRRAKLFLVQRINLSGTKLFLSKLNQLLKSNQY